MTDEKKPHLLRFDRHKVVLNVDNHWAARLDEWLVDCVMVGNGAIIEAVHLPTHGMIKVRQREFRLNELVRHLASTEIDWIRKELDGEG